MFSIGTRERSHSLKDVSRWWSDGDKGGFIAKLLIKNTTLPNGEPVDRFIVEQNKGLFSHMDMAIPPKKDSFPPGYIIDMCLNKIFVEELDKVEFSLSFTGLDYLATFERMRVATLQTAAMNLRITEFNWRDVLADHQEAKSWVESVIRRSFHIDLLYARLWVDLRIWTMAKSLEAERFDEAEAISVLNTLFPPSTEILPNQNVTEETIASHRATFFNYLAAAGRNSADNITAYIQGLNSPANERNWPSVRKTLKEYLSVTGDFINEAYGVRDARELGNSVKRLSFDNFGPPEIQGYNSTPRQKKSQPQLRDSSINTTPTEDRERSVSFGDTTVINDSKSNHIPRTPAPLTPTFGMGPLKSSFARSSTSSETKSIVPLTPGLRSHSYHHGDQTDSYVEPSYEPSGYESFMKVFSRDAGNKESSGNQSFDEMHPRPQFAAGRGSSDSFGRGSTSTEPSRPLPLTPKISSPPFAHGFKSDSNVFRSGPERITFNTAASAIDEHGLVAPSSLTRPRIRPPIPATPPAPMDSETMGRGSENNEPNPYVTSMEDASVKNTKDPRAKSNASNTFFSLGKRNVNKSVEGDTGEDLPSFDRCEDPLNSSPRARNTLKKAQSAASLRSEGTGGDVGTVVSGKDRNFSKSSLGGEVLTRAETPEPSSQGFKALRKPASYFKWGKNSEGDGLDEGGNKKEKSVKDRLLSETPVGENCDEYFHDILLKKVRDERNSKARRDMPPPPPPTPNSDQSGMSERPAEQTPKISTMGRVIKNFASSYSPAG